MRTRRQFLQNTTVAAVAALTPAFMLGAALPVRQAHLSRIGLDEFGRQLHSRFRVHPVSASSVTLELVEVRPGRPALARDPLALDASYEKFSLLFRGPEDQRLGQETHLFEHARLGAFSIFIVPVVLPDTAHAYYEAIFNRPAPDTFGRARA